MGRLSKKDKLRFCAGCKNNFYNGNNHLNIEECWSFKSSKVVMRKKVYIDQYPPWNQKPIKILSCFHQPRYVFVGPKQTH
ncbi:hypothetical protein LCGC14_1415130 [marine sediment metagenome]|uniref:Uncharacterized protein n=1 Tax=marine sediment metagenome TaxID=412755 RepID=A0A0F9JTG2_9ZZZZ